MRNDPAKIGSDHPTLVIAVAILCVLSGALLFPLIHSHSSKSTNISTTTTTRRTHP